LVSPGFRASEYFIAVWFKERHSVSFKLVFDEAWEDLLEASLFLVIWEWMQPFPKEGWAQYFSKN